MSKSYSQNLGCIPVNRQLHAEGQIVDVAAGGRGGVGHGVGVAVVAVGVGQAAGVVERLVGQEAVVGLLDLRVLHLQVVAAGALLLDRLREVGHEVRALAVVGDAAGCFERLGEADGRLGGGEEAIGCLMCLLEDFSQ